MVYKNLPLTTRPPPIPAAFFHPPNSGLSQCWVLSIVNQVSIYNYPSLLSPLGFPGGSDGKESACSAGEVGSIPGSGRRKWQPAPAFLPREFHRQRNLAGYSSWGRKESDKTEWLSHTEPISTQVNTPFAHTSFPGVNNHSIQFIVRFCLCGSQFLSRHSSSSAMPICVSMSLSPHIRSSVWTQHRLPQRCLTEHLPSLDRFTLGSSVS